MAILTDIKTSNWGISTRGCGYVEQGIEDVRQCIDVLLRTQKGTDPLRPEFGSDIYQHIDKPVNLVIPNVKRAIILAIELYEQRVEVKSVAHIIDKSAIQFFITYKLVDDNLIDQLQLYLNEGSFIVTPAILGSVIIEADIPAASTYQLLVNFIINGKAALPLPPKFGFANTSIMYAWIQVNWGSFGNWYLTAGKLVGYLNTTITSASLSITTSNLYRYSSPILNLAVGQSYGLIFSANPADIPVRTIVSPVMNQLLNFASSNYGNFGTWVIEGSDGKGNFMILDRSGDFESSDFNLSDFDAVVASPATGDFDQSSFSNSDFNTILYYQLVLYTAILPNSKLIVIAA